MTSKDHKRLIPWIGEIPTEASYQKALTVRIATLLLAFMSIGFWYVSPEAIEAYFTANEEVKNYLLRNKYLAILRLMPYAAAGYSVLLFATGAFSFVKTKLSVNLLRSSLWLLYPITAAWLVFIWLVLFGILDIKLAADDKSDDVATTLKLWWSFSWPMLAAAIYAYWLRAMSYSRSVYAAMTNEAGQAMAGDKTLEDWRTHGKDPEGRKSLYKSIFTHWVILILIPFILQFRGCIEPYRPPKGAGENAVPVQVKVVKKKKKKKQFKLRSDSAIIMKIPPLDEIDKVMEEMTEVQYETMAHNAKAGTPGKGGGKGPPGWPEGQEGAEIRFIRLSHSGVGWDDGMKASKADRNFMREFQKITKFKKVRKQGEAHSIGHLALYPADGFPPFVFLTGNGAIRGVSNNDIKILREYCMKGGMLVADAGSASFDRSFRDLMRKVFPGNALLDIADDDRLYQLPFNFPNGAPSFWHHGGKRGLGIKHNQRWMVFYHPGDMNDAWKSSGYSDVTPEMRRNAYNLGINIIFYAFNEWNDAVAKLRK